MNLVFRGVVEINATPAKVWTTITDSKITKHWAM